MADRGARRISAACGLLALALSRGAFHACAFEQGSVLPEIPQPSLAAYPRETRQQVEQAYAAARDHPQDAAAVGKLGMLLQALNFFSEAEACYRRARQLDPPTFRWAYYLGRVQSGQGNFDAAATTFREALQGDANYLPAQLELGECLLASGKWNEAAQVYAAIVKKHPDCPEAYYGAARVQAVRKDLDGAIESFRRACDLAPNFAAAHYGLAHVYEREGKTDLSLRELGVYNAAKTSAPVLQDPLLDEVKALNVHSPDPLRAGMEWAEEGKLQEAAGALEKALEANPELVEAHIKLVALYSRLGRPISAEEHFQAAVRLDPRNAENYFNHGRLLAGQEKFVEAEEAFRNTLEINPKYPGAHLELGSMLEAQGNLTEALAEYQKALAGDPDNPRTHFQIGRILVNEEKYQEGIQHLLKCLTTSDEAHEPAYLYALGAAYARSGDRSNGLRYLRLAREKAAAQGQAKLQESIDADLRSLEAGAVSP